MARIERRIKFSGAKWEKQAINLNRKRNNDKEQMEKFVHCTQINQRGKNDITLPKIKAIFGLVLHLGITKTMD